jgi:CheY-like chemotaxis protein
MGTNGFSNSSERKQANFTGKPQAPGDGHGGTAGTVLSSWKEIAAYLGRSVRTVQRMEVELGLPVRRPKGHARSSVMAIPQELDAWLKSFSPQRTDAFLSLSPAPLPTRRDSSTRVLVVDDKEITLYLMTKNLKAHGYEVSTAQSSRAALKMAFFADVVLLDVNLPDIHGFEVLRRLRSSLTTSHIPVICTSATYGPEGAAPLALQLGAKRFLPHPISPEKLHSTIQDVLESEKPTLPETAPAAKASD